MEVSVCIVNWNTRELLRNCLRSIEIHTRGVQHEVVVVDNASTDGSCEIVREQFPWVKLVASADNLGFARGCNLAVTSSVGEYVLYLNPDTELVTNAIEGMHRYLRSRPECGAVGCRLLNTDGSIQFTCASAFPSPRNELTSMLLLDRAFPRSAALSSRELNHWSHKDSRDIECLSGACMMMPRLLVDRLGGFDESLFMYGEDLDLCFRVRQQGLALHYLADESIYHHEGAASRTKGRSFAPLRQRQANYYFLQKNFGISRAVGYRAAVFVGSVARLLAGAVIGPLALLKRRRAGSDLEAFLAKYGDLLLWSHGIKGMPSR